MIRSHISFSFLFILVLASCVPKTPQNWSVANSLKNGLESRIDSLLNAALDAEKMSGAVVLVADRKNVLIEKAYGYHTRETKRRLLTSDIFRIASMTKPITAVAVMMLYEEQKFQLDDAVSDYLSEFSESSILTTVDMTDSTWTSVAAADPITIRHLLTHTSGIGYGFLDEQLMALYQKAGITEGFEERDIPTNENCYRIAGMPLMHSPGERFTYGLNYDVLGCLVEEVSGMSLQEFFETRIFEPLEMTDTYFYLPQEKMDRLVGVYMNREEELLPTDYPLIHYPVRGAQTYFSGGADLSSTGIDYIRFCQMLLNEGSYKGRSILNKTTIEEMVSTQFEMGDLDVGLGVTFHSAQSPLQRLPVGSFSGGGFFSTYFWVDPVSEMIVVMMMQMYPFEYQELFQDLQEIFYE